jgi:hypothetical protein
MNLIQDAAQTAQGAAQAAEKKAVELAPEEVAGRIRTGR